MKHILVFGAPPKNTSLIGYLVAACEANQWQLTLVDENRNQALLQTKNAPNTNALALHLHDELGRRILIATADLVIAQIPHYLIALDCLLLNKNVLFTCSIDEQIASLAPKIESKGLLFLHDVCIEEMAARQLIDRIKASGRSVHSLISYCGELPETGVNPWQHVFNGMPIQADYEMVTIPEFGELAWQFAGSLFNMPTFVRRTLYYPAFCFGWKHLVDLQLTDDTQQYDTDGMSLQTFFQMHFAKYGFSDWIEKQLTERFTQSKVLLEKLQDLLDIQADDFMMVDPQGQLMDVNLDAVKTQAAETVAGQMQEANLAMQQLLYLGIDDGSTFINRGVTSAVDVLRFILEQKLTGENKWTVIYQEIVHDDGQESSQLITDKATIAPAIIAELMLTNKITLTGLQKAHHSQIYEPVLVAMR